MLLRLGQEIAPNQFLTRQVTPQTWARFHHHMPCSHSQCLSTAEAAHLQGRARQQLPTFSSREMAFSYPSFPRIMCWPCITRGRKAGGQPCFLVVCFYSLQHPYMHLKNVSFPQPAIVFGLLWTPSTLAYFAFPGVCGNLGESLLEKQTSQSNSSVLSINAKSSLGLRCLAELSTSNEW